MVVAATVILLLWCTKLAGAGALPRRSLTALRVTLRQRELKSIVQIGAHRD
jgi:hypothetical protein